MKQNNLLNKWIRNRCVRTVAVMAATVLTVLSVCCFDGVRNLVDSPDRMADGCSRMSAFQTIEGNAATAFSGEFPDGNNGIHLNLRESDQIPGEADRETADQSDPDGILQGNAGDDTVSQDAGCPDRAGGDAAGQDTESQDGVSESGVVLVNDDTTEETSEYFYTTIDEKEILTDVSYSFSIIHLKPELTVESTTVTVNDAVIRNFQGKCRLVQGNNSIRVKVTYQKQDKTYVTQERSYRVQVELTDIAITTDLKDGVVTDQPTLCFTARAKRQGNPAKLAASVNKKALAGKALTDGNQEYSCTLAEGKNEIVLTAEDTYGKKELVVHLEYQAAKTKLVIETDLEDRTVSSPNLEFTAKAYQEEKKEAVSLSVSVNGIRLMGETDVYRAELNEGKNAIVLSAGAGEQEVCQTYHIKYVPEIVDPGGEDPSLTAPRLETDLVDGSTMTGNTLTFYIKPTSYQGERIRGQNVVVTCNDSVTGYVWDDSTTTSYRMELQDGENRITITPTDQEGHTLTFPYKITCNGVGGGESLGHVTLSIEATTVGLGNIVDSTEVEIFQGVNAAKMLTELLGEYGYDYSSTGSIDSGFYLSSIKGSGIVNEPSVPSDLEKRLLEEEGSEYDMEKYNSDSLGEFDFCKGSGWMYSVNGHYPNYGFSDCYPHDGDVIRIRFTLYYGKDIGGGYAMGEGDEENWGDW